MLFGTQLIGDATNWPTFKATSEFIGDGVLETDKYIGGKQKGADQVVPLSPTSRG
jgi:hypothetical protein